MIKYLAVILVLASPAMARDFGQYANTDPEIRDWIRGLRDSKGVGCCDTADGYPPEEVEWDTKENSYRVKIDGQWYEVPDGAVIREPNKLGYARVWFIYIDGKPSIRCFLPGSGS